MINQLRDFVLRTARYKHVILALLVLLPVAASAQLDLTRHQWLFGTSPEHLIFDASTNEARLDSLQIPLGFGGSAVAASAITGGLLFYSDGVNVYDSEHRIMPNGAGLDGNASIHRGVAILPVPDSLGLYHLIVNSGAAAPNAIQRYFVNLNEMGNNTGANQPPAGDVAAGAPVSLLANPTEAMEVLFTNRSELNFLLVQEAGSNDLFLFRNDGLAGLTPTDTLTLPQPVEAASFAWHLPTQQVAIAPRDQFRNIQIITVDVLTGTMAFDQELLNTGNSDFATEAIYDTEWSPDARYLYISRHGGGSPDVATVFQYDFLDTAPVPRSIFAAALHRSYDLSLAPNGSIYHLYQETAGGDFLLGRLTNPLDSIDSLVYLPAEFEARDFAARSLPLFSPPGAQDTLSVSISARDLCLGNDTKFFANVFPKADTYNWDFGDGGTSQEPAPVHTFDAAGTFQVVLTASRGEQTGQDTILVTIIDPMEQLDLGMDTVICVDETLTLDATTNGAVSYAWNTGETTPTIVVDTTNLYWVVVDLGGCSLYDAILVEEYGVQENISNFWYFGENAGIDFNNGVTPLDDGAMIAPGGSATISDPNGELLFYTNGSTVYNKDHLVMPNGTMLGGDSIASQSAAIVPFPGDSTYYYIFSTQEVYGTGSYDLVYSVVDIKGDNGLGEVTEKNICLFENSTERLAIAGGGVGQDAWVVVHEHGSANFAAFPVTDAGIGPPTLSTVGSVHLASSELTAKGYMKFNNTIDLLAVALATPGANYAEVFRFDGVSGELNPYIGRLEVGPSFNPSQQAYGVEFSAASRKLFVSLIGTPSEVYEYWIDSADVDVAKSFEALISPVGSSLEYGAIQRGPDQTVYVAVNNQAQLGAVLENEDSLIASGFSDAQVSLLAGTRSTLGLPNTDPGSSSPPQGPGIAISQGCAGDTINFTATTTSIIDEVQWSIATPAPASSLLFSSTNEQDQFVFDTPGTYDFTLRITNRCGLDTTLTQSLVIPEGPNVNEFPGPQAICGPGLQLEAFPRDTAAFNYLWSTGETTRVITVSAPGIYEVTITNGTGCSASSGNIQVVDGNPPIDLGVDPQVICQDAPIPDLDAGNPGATYAWFLNGALVANTTRFQTVDTSTPGTFQYRVEVTDPVSGCTGSDSITYSINTNPAATAVATPTTGCGNADGSIDLTVSNPGNFTFAWSSGQTTEDVSGLAPGVYSVTVTDAVSGCTSTVSAIGVDDGAPDYAINSAIPSGAVCPGSTGTNVLISLSTSTVFPVNFTIDDGAGNVQSGVAASAGTDFTISNVQPGTYSLQVVGNNGTGCVQTDNFTVNTAPTVPATVAEAPVADFCADNTNNGQFTLNASFDADFSYTWTTTGGNIVSSTTGNTVVIDQSGTYDVLVSDITGTRCDTTISVEVSISQTPNVEIQAVSDGCDGTLELSAVDLNNTGSGSYTYLWDNGSNAQNIVINSNSTVSVTVNNTNGGCVANADSTFTVEQPVSVVLSNDQPLCDLSGDVLLTASVTNPNVTFAWQIDGLPVSNATDSTLLINQPGTYQVDVALGVCTDASSLVITQNTSTPSELLDDYEICSLDPANGQVALDPGPFVLFTWILPDGGTATGAPFLAGQQGVYLGEFTNGGGCVTLDTLLVRDVCEPIIDVPTAFAPGRNNPTFQVFPNEYVTGFEILIYNRWGELVHIYEGEAEQFAWGGLLENGSDAPSGTYAYVMRYTSEFDPGRGVIEQRGGVVLLR